LATLSNIVHTVMRISVGELVTSLLYRWCRTARHIRAFVHLVGWTYYAEKQCPVVKYLVMTTDVATSLSQKPMPRSSLAFCMSYDL